MKLAVAAAITLAACLAAAQRPAALVYGPVVAGSEEVEEAREALRSEESLSSEWSLYERYGVRIAVHRDSTGLASASATVALFELAATTPNDQGLFEARLGSECLKQFARVKPDLYDALMRGDPETTVEVAMRPSALVWVEHDGRSYPLPCEPMRVGNAARPAPVELEPASLANGPPAIKWSDTQEWRIEPLEGTPLSRSLAASAAAEVMAELGLELARRSTSARRALEASAVFGPEITLLVAAHGERGTLADLPAHYRVNIGRVVERNVGPGVHWQGLTVTSVRHMATFNIRYVGSGGLVDGISITMPIPD